MDIVTFDRCGGQLAAGDCLEYLKTLPDGSVDSVVTDPPYGLGEVPDTVAVLTAWLAGERYLPPSAKGFCGKEWDAFVPGPEYWGEVYRVLKPGGHMLAFSSSRTYDLLAIAVRLAGFEVRDQLQWLYGSGFPKNLNISKAIDKHLGYEREVVDRQEVTSGGMAHISRTNVEQGYRPEDYHAGVNIIETSLPASDEAKQWDGWGTALKPAHEPICMARKPIVGSITKNVLEHGTGGLNIKGCTVGDELLPAQRAGQAQIGTFEREDMVTPEREGRWPSNVLMDEDAAAQLDQQSGPSTSRASAGRNGNNVQGVTGMMAPRSVDMVRGHNDSGGASRFFYVAKASRAEKEAGLKSLPLRDFGFSGGATGAIEAGEDYDEAQSIGLNRIQKVRNPHPTVKPIELMRYLVRLVTPPGGVVLDPFAGSGTTCIAAALEGLQFKAAEISEEYVRTAVLRIEHWATPVHQRNTDLGNGRKQMTLEDAL